MPTNCRIDICTLRRGIGHASLAAIPVKIPFIVVELEDVVIRISPAIVTSLESIRSSRIILIRRILIRAPTRTLIRVVLGKDSWKSSDAVGKLASS